METSEQEIFEKLGNLFYAIARDQQVDALEIGKLKMVIRKNWYADPEGADERVVPEASHHIVLAMDALMAEESTAEEAFETFSKFYTSYKTKFPDSLRKKILSTAEAITEVFPSQSRLKNNHVIKLRLLFQNSGLIA